MRDPREDPELLALVQRYVLPGREWLRAAPHMRHRGEDPGLDCMGLVRRFCAVVEECAEGSGEDALGPT